MMKIFSSLRYRNFRLFWFGQMISLCGTWMQSVAQSWLVLELTNSAFLLGMVNAIAGLPILLFSLIGGVVADHLNKRNLIVLTQNLSMILAFALGVLASLHLVKFWHIGLIAGLLGIVNAFDSPARQAFVIEMVSKEDLDNAIALNSLIFSAARIIGPVIAGFLVGTLGVNSCFYVNGFSFMAVIISLFSMRGDFSPKNSLEGSVTKKLLDGAKYVWTEKKIRRLTILAATSSIFGISCLVLMPIFARNILNAGAKSLGILIASIGLGAILASVTLTLFSYSPKNKRSIFIGGLVLAIMLIVFSFSRSLPLSVIALTGVGWGLITQTAMINSLLQTSTPDYLRGRIMGFYTLVFLGMMPIGSFQAGLIAHWLGAQVSVRLGGLICLIIVLVFSRGIE